VTLDSSKTLGGVGAILLFIGVIAFFAYPFLAILGLIGIILVLVALHDLANNYKESGIFNNALFSFIAGIVGLVVTGITVVYLFFLHNYLYGFLSRYLSNLEWRLDNAFRVNTKHLKHYRK
jgi:uncharacterized membrane protein